MLVGIVLVFHTLRSVCVRVLGVVVFVWGFHAWWDVHRLVSDLLVCRSWSVLICVFINKEFASFMLLDERTRLQTPVFSFSSIVSDSSSLSSCSSYFAAAAHPSSLAFPFCLIGMMCRHGQHGTETLLFWLGIDRLAWIEISKLSFCYFSMLKDTISPLLFT